MVQISISSDRLKAFLEVEGPAELADVAGALKSLSIVFGIDPAAIQEAIAGLNPNQPICVAAGTDPVPSTASRVELAMEQDLASGALDEDSGVMDFRERGGVHSVKTKELIGVWYPGTDGTPGTGVDGLPVDPPAPATKDQSRGSHVRSKAGTEGSLLLYAEIDGVVRTGPAGDVYVTDIFEVDGDVDLSCGNIEVNGSVHIHGTIRSGFRVHAGQDIDVDKTIENADVKAGQSLCVGAGILAGDDGIVQAEDLIQAKFSQNANLRSGGDVILEVDTNSTIEAAGNIFAKDGAGHLRGGNYLAGQSLVAKELGSTQGVETRVQVGMDPKLARELARIGKDLMQAQARAKKLQRESGVQNAKRMGSNLTRDQASGVRRTMKAKRELQKSIAILNARREEIEASRTQGGYPLVRIEKKVHAGVRIQIGNAHLTIDHTRPGGTFRLDPETGKITTS
ncbi:MAG: DUF342 domain-containing protein [Planctomycetes bacterium]|nr:DUF342 domain-containing protein [Planctomycetota bacterium]